MRQATVIQNTQAHLKSKGEEAFANHDANSTYLVHLKQKLLVNKPRTTCFIFNLVLKEMHTNQRLKYQKKRMEGL